MYRSAAIAALVLSACTGPDRPDPAEARAEAVAEERTDAEDDLATGHGLMEANEPERALRTYLRSAATRGIDAELLAALGSANLELGRLGQAETLLRRATELDPRLASAQNNLGVVLMERGKPFEAVGAFRAALNLEGEGREDINANLALALAKVEESAYRPAEGATFALERRGSGRYVIRPTS